MFAFFIGQLEDELNLKEFFKTITRAFCNEDSCISVKDVGTMIFGKKSIYACDPAYEHIFWTLDQLEAEPPITQDGFLILPDTKTYYENSKKKLNMVYGIVEEKYIKNDIESIQDALNEMYKKRKSNNFYDPVSCPAHYAEGRIYEPRKVIADWGLNYHLGNALKYISRAGRKGNAIQDLEKAQQYIAFEIDWLKLKEPDRYSITIKVSKPGFVPPYRTLYESIILLAQMEFSKPRYLSVQALHTYLEDAFDAGALIEDNLPMVDLNNYGWTRDVFEDLSIIEEPIDNFIRITISLPMPEPQDL